MQIGTIVALWLAIAQPRPILVLQATPFVDYGVLEARIVDDGCLDIAYLRQYARHIGADAVLIDPAPGVKTAFIWRAFAAPPWNFSGPPRFAPCATRARVVRFTSAAPR